MLLFYSENIIYKLTAIILWINVSSVFMMRKFIYIFFLIIFFQQYKWVFVINENIQPYKCCSQIFGKVIFRKKYTFNSVSHFSIYSWNKHYQIFNQMILGHIVSHLGEHAVQFLQIAANATVLRNDVSFMIMPNEL